MHTIYCPIGMIVLLGLCSMSVLHACEAEWSARIQLNASAEYHHSDELLTQIHGHTSFINGALDARINGSVYPSDTTGLHAAYEIIGQTRKTISKITDTGLPLRSSLFTTSGQKNIDNLFSLTKVLEQNEEYVLYHRIDRLFFSYNGEPGNIYIGRQALTWGNGLLFNPADLLNPFAPSDIIRDYKAGSDMIVYQHAFERVQDLQLVGVPRKDEKDDLSMDESTFGIKLTLPIADNDVDLFLLKNRQDPILGAGIVSSVGDGVLRADLTWTSVNADASDEESFVSAVINYDYSWIMADANWYGFLEFYYNGLGVSHSDDASRSEALLARLDRGEIFVTGHSYISGMLQYEAHPLVNIYTTFIFNINDNSILLQPRLNWDLTADAGLLLGANIAVGSTHSEFGKRVDNETGLVAGTPQQLYLLLRYYF